MPRRFSEPVRRITRHRTLIVGAVIVLAGLLAPLFAGKQLSPADIFELYPPWRTGEIVPANGLMNDPATAYFTAVPMMRRSAASFVWNPFLGSGTPGWHSAGRGLLSPFALIPALLLPLGYFFVGVVVLKFLASLLLAYGWLRQEKLGRDSAAIGAVVVAAGGAASMWWLWPSTSATVLCPAVLWIVARLREGRRTPIALSALTGLALLLSGYPAAILYVFYLGCAYAIHAALAARVSLLRSGAAILAGGAIALAIAFPALAPFAATVRRSGYLEHRANAAAVAYPASHLLSFLKPYRLIRAGEGWTGDPALGPNDTLQESTIYVGKLPLLFAAAALTLLRRRRTAFWSAATALLIAAMFGVPLVSEALAALPGMRYTPLTRLRFLLPVVFGYLAAAGFRRLRDLIHQRRTQGASVTRWLAIGAVAAVAIDLTLFLRSFTPYVDARLAVPRTTPAIEWLHAQPKPFRIAALGPALWPDTAEYVGLEDIRSHHPVERDYRRLLAQIDPRSFGSTGTVLQLHPETTDLESPVLSFLNVRFMLEAPGGGTLERTLTGRTMFDTASPAFVRLEQGSTSRGTSRPGPDVTALAVELRAEHDAVVEIGSVAHRIRRGVTRIYVPADGAGGMVSVTARTGSIEIRSDADATVDVGTTSFPWIPAHRGPDLTIFRNLRAHQRVFGVPDHGSSPLRLDVSAADGKLLVRTRSERPFVLASSEKLTDELLVSVDGAAARPEPLEGLFAAVKVPAGGHTVVYERRIPPLRASIGILGLIGFAASLLAELRVRRRRLAGAGPPTA